MKGMARVFLLLGFLLVSCTARGSFATISGEVTPTEDSSDQVATLVAEALQRTAAAEVTLTPAPTLTQVAASSIQKHYQSPALGIMFDYPENWHVQETADLPIQVILASFDPANPPHKLEWRPETTSLEFHLLPAGIVPPTLDAWVEDTKRTAVSNQLEISKEERFQIANQPAALISLVSGSGGIIHQVLTIQDKRYYEIDIEGNLDLGKSVLNTFQLIQTAELKLPDSDSPAAGVCAEVQGDQVSIILGSGPDGLPKAGRCIVVRSTQRLQFINQSDTDFHYKLPGLNIDLPAGQEILLEKPVGSYFAPGVHFLPMGPELWLKGKVEVTAPAATQPGPNRVYDNPDLSVRVTLPPGWNVEEHGLSAPNKEVIFSPTGADASVVYLSIRVDPRSLEEIENEYAQNIQGAVKDNVIFNGLPGIKYTNGYRMEFYIPYQNQIVAITTEKPDDSFVQLILMSVFFK